MSSSPPPDTRACEVVIEVPAWSFVKRRPSGAVEFFSPLPSPFNYGSIVGTRGPDGDPLDAVVLGPRLPLGARVTVCAFAEVDFLDGGVPDPKRICGRRPGPLDRVQVIAFFRLYAAAKRVFVRGRSGPTQYCGFRPL